MLGSLISNQEIEIEMRPDSSFAPWGVGVGVDDDAKDSNGEGDKEEEATKKILSNKLSNIRKKFSINLRLKVQEEMEKNRRKHQASLLDIEASLSEILRWLFR